MENFSKSIANVYRVISERDKKINIAEKKIDSLEKMVG